MCRINSKTNQRCRSGYATSKGAGAGGNLASITVWLITGLFCLLGPSAQAAEPLAVTVTIAPQAWLVEQIGGDRVVVKTLVGPGESPATYLPTDAQVSSVLRSAVYFRIGVPSEETPWLDALRRSRRVEIVDLRDGVELRHLPGGHHHEAATRQSTGTIVAGQDPHIWLSPKRLVQLANTIADTLVRLDPAAAPRYRERLTQLIQRLDALDTKLRQQLTMFTGRAFLVFHPAWGYFANDYGLRQLAVEVEGKEPSESEVTELQAIARRERIPTIFVQPQITGRSAQALAIAIGGQTQILDPLEPNVIDNLSRVGDRIAAALETP